MVIPTIGAPPPAIFKSTRFSRKVFQLPRLKNNCQLLQKNIIKTMDQDND